MLFDSFLFKLLGNIPEAIAIIALGTAVIREKISISAIFGIGVLLGIFYSLILHLSPIEYGIHVPVGIVAITLILNLILKITLLKSAAAALISYVILALLEFITINIVIINLLGYSEDLLKEGTDLQIYYITLPTLIIYVAMAVIMQWLLRRKKGSA